MRIVFVIGLYPYQIGGAEMQAREIAQALINEGYEVSYLCYSKKKYSCDDFLVRIIPHKSNYDFLYLGTKEYLFNALDDLKPDIVYHRAFVPYSSYIAYWCKKNNIPFYFHCADLYTLTKKNISLKNIVHNLMLSYTLKNAEGVICQNFEQFNILSKFKINKLKIIYNIQSINTQIINKHKSKNIIWIGKFESIKQPEIFIDFAERCSINDISFTMFSSKYTQSEFNNKLFLRIKNNPRIELIVGKDNSYINDYLCNSASILLNTSISEGISNTFIQAWMRGVPVISLNSNPDNWFNNYEIGGCCKGDSLFIDKFVNYILSDSNYSRISDSCIKFSNNMFSPKVITPQLKSFMNL